MDKHKNLVIEIVQRFGKRIVRLAPRSRGTRSSSSLTLQVVSVKLLLREPIQSLCRDSRCIPSSAIRLQFFEIELGLKMFVMNSIRRKNKNVCSHYYSNNVMTYICLRSGFQQRVHTIQ